MNSLYYGDNLDNLRKHIRDETVDLCYIDPPEGLKRRTIAEHCMRVNARGPRTFRSTRTNSICDARTEGACIRSR